MLHDVLSCGFGGAVRCVARLCGMQGQVKGQGNKQAPGLMARRERCRVLALVGALGRSGVVRG